MNYKYMKTSRIDVQGSIDIVSGVAGTLNQDLTGTYDIDDIKALLGDYMIIDEDNTENGELGLRNYFTHPTYLDVSEITIKKATSGFDVTKFNNLLKLLGFSNGKILYNDDQTFDELEPSWGIVYSPYMGGKIPLRFGIPNNKHRCGYSTYEPYEEKNGGKTYVSNTGVYSNNFRIRRGMEMRFRGSKIFVSQIDITKDVFKSPVKWYIPSDFEVESEVGLILDPHRSFSVKLIYPTIGLNEISISFLQEV